MKRGFVIALFVVLLIFAVLSVLTLIFLAGAMGDGGGGRVSGKTLLEIDFESAIVEYLPPDPIGQVLLEETPQLRDLVEALHRGAEDDRVVGLVARIGGGNLGFAQLQEVRQAVIDFRASGKPAVVFSETFGEMAPGNGGYYLATAFDEIYLQPSGDVNLTGLLLESQFLSGTLEKLGLEPRMDHRHEYKNALNSYTERSFTPAHEEAMQDLLESIFGQMVSDISSARGLEPEALKDLIDGAPFYGQEAVDAGLVDGLLYRDEALARLREHVGDGGANAKLLYAHKYLAKVGRPHDSGPGVALIYGVGGIQRGPSQYSPMTGGMVMGSETVAAAFRAAIDDEDIQAILFRIDCNGGSYVASDTVWRETVRAREAGKPVIVSFGNVAASGGYFVALEADKIVAQPGTITGSIGVLGGKMVTIEMWDKLGISWDEVHSSENAEFYAGNYDYSDAEWARFQAWLDRVYEDFTQKVAEGRNLPIETVREIAKGRVWTGEAALENGLVDALGGYDVALDLVRESIELEAGAGVDLQVFPRPQNPWEGIFGQGPDSSEGRVALRAMAAIFEELRPMVTLGQRLGLLEPLPSGVVYPEEWVPRP